MFPLGWWRVVIFESQCAYWRKCFYPQRSRRICLVKHYYEASFFEQIVHVDVFSVQTGSWKTMSERKSMSNTGQSWTCINWELKYFANKFFPWRYSDRYPHRPLGIANQTNQPYWLASVCKNINQSEPEGQILNLASKSKSKSKVTRGFSFSPLRDSCSRLCGSLAAHTWGEESREEKNRGKPLWPGYPPMERKGESWQFSSMCCNMFRLHWV